MILFLQVANLSNIILHEHRATNIFHYIRLSVAFLCVGVSTVGTHLKYVSMRHSFTEITQKLELELRRAAFRSRRDCRHIDYVTDARGNKDRRALQSWSTSLARGHGHVGGVIPEERPGAGCGCVVVVTYLQAAGEGEGEQQVHGRGRRAHGVSEARGASGALPGALAACRAGAGRSLRRTALHCPLGTLQRARAAVWSRSVAEWLSFSGRVHTCALRGAPVGTARRAAPLPDAARPTDCDGRLHFTTSI